MLSASATAVGAFAGIGSVSAATTTPAALKVLHIPFNFAETSFDPARSMKIGRAHV